MKKLTFVHRLSGNRKEENGMCDLSEREIEILKLAADGLSNKLIADRLNIAEDTVDSHNRNIVKRLKSQNMKHAIANAMRKKIIE